MFLGEPMPFHAVALVARHEFASGNNRFGEQAELIPTDSCLCSTSCCCAALPVLCSTSCCFRGAYRAIDRADCWVGSTQRIRMRYGAKSSAASGLDFSVADPDATCCHLHYCDLADGFGRLQRAVLLTIRGWMEGFDAAGRGIRVHGRSYFVLLRFS